ncbi:MAG: hypothetical protein MJ025_01165 [Victivallaceae bacterium]|nr:hypothetical protein [Victivallaceae bacterium]
MMLFLIGMAILAIGYFTYGSVVEKTLGPDERKTCAFTHTDGLDYVPMSGWRNMLIHLLNIAGTGPIIGAILGIRFGAIAFLVIPIGNVLGGATHDFLSGFMSMRSNGASMPTIAKDNLGKVFGTAYLWIFTILLLLVTAVFVNVPATQLARYAGGSDCAFWIFVVVIFGYYAASTIFPIDKVIGRAYPLFGFLLMLGTIALLAMLIFYVARGDFQLGETTGFMEHMSKAPHGPFVPLFFVTVSCGMISGFHATQTTIVARTMKTEKQAKATFYGMMVLEGVIAMIWAAAAMALYNNSPELMHINPNMVLAKIADTFLGKTFGAVATGAVVIQAITSGDTSLRSCRMNLCEQLNIRDRSLVRQLTVCMPMFIVIIGFLWWSNASASGFNQLWNYFAWGNQLLSASMLLTATVWMIRTRRNWLVAAGPAVFMTFIVFCFIMWTSPKHPSQPYGLGLDLGVSIAIGVVLTVITISAVIWHGFRMKKLKGLDSI